MAAVLESQAETMLTGRPLIIADSTSKAEAWTM